MSLKKGASRMKSTRADAAMMDRWRRALDQWEARGEGATSSITGGGAIRTLEEAFGERLSGRACLALGSGTAALAACLIGVGVRPGDHVLTAGLDWPAATEAIRWIGATPRYVDVDHASATVSPNCVARSWDDRVTAVVGTHLFGIPVDVPALRRALPSEVPIVEDCAQALGARLDGSEVGTLADAAAFSFGPGKLIDAGEGGLAVFASEDDWGRAVVATQHSVRALVTEAETRVRLPSRIHPMAALLALFGLEDLEERLENRRSAVQGWFRCNQRTTPVGWDARRRPSLWRVAVRQAPRNLTTPLTSDLALGTSATTPVARALVDEVRLARIPTTGDWMQGVNHMNEE